MSSIEVDAHFHVWELERFKYPWPNDSVAPIYKTITFPDLTLALNSANVKNAVFIQCLNDCPEEAIWVMESRHPAIKGVVAGVTLEDHHKLELQLDMLCKYPEFVGVRHILDMEASNDWIIGQDVIEGLKIVAARGKTFDFEFARPHHLQHVATVAKAVPNLKIVIDHVAKPVFLEGLDPAWKRNMEMAALCPNVFCKISGLVTEVDPDHHKISWDTRTFSEHVKCVLHLFGSDRCMIGSDWPVLGLAGADYKKVNSLHKELLGHLSEKERMEVLGGTATVFYQLKDLGS